jgi:hypothetical protein
MEKQYKALQLTYHQKKTLEFLKSDQTESKSVEGQKVF